jgi:hypothetical protein
MCLGKRAPMFQANMLFPSSGQEKPIFFAPVP